MVANGRWLLYHARAWVWWQPESALYIVDTQSWQEVAVVQLGESIEEICWSADGGRVAVHTCVYEPVDAVLASKLNVCILDFGS